MKKIIKLALVFILVFSMTIPSHAMEISAIGQEGTEPVLFGGDIENCLSEERGNERFFKPAEESARFDKTPETEFKEQLLTETEFEAYAAKGIINDISFDEWRKIEEQSVELEKKLMSSDEFSLAYNSKEIGNRSSFQLQPGDILITNGTNSSGSFLGHAGIATSSYNVLHIAGFDCTPEMISIYDWNNRYSRNDKWTIVYRHNSPTAANAAVLWAINTYLFSGASYAITIDLAGTNPTYCSKIVWQAYAYGPSPAEVLINIPYGFVTPMELPYVISNIESVHVYTGY